jgi:hypothetical protein
MAGFALGLSNLVTFGIMGLIFYIGALFNVNENIKLDPVNMFISINSIMFAAMGAGINFNL